MTNRRFTLSLILVALFGSPMLAQTTRNVLVLHNGSPNLPTNMLFSAALRTAFASNLGVELFEEYIDEDRLIATDGRLTDVLRTKYTQKTMDLVIADGAPALTFLLHRGEKLWPGAPKLFHAVLVGELPPRLPTNMTGVASNVDYGATADLALRLMPDTRRVFYVGGVRPTEKTWRGLAQQDLKHLAGRIELTYLDNLSLPELLDRLGQLPPHSVVIYGGLFQDARGRTYVPARVCSLIASAANAPVYGVYSTFLGCGIVGGSMLDFQALADQSAALALRVIERGDVTGFPMERSAPSRFVMDWRQLERWHIDESALPVGAEIRFRIPSAWDRYRREIVSTLAVVVLLVCVIIVLLVEKEKHKRADHLIKSLSGRLITATEEERKRIARELHDDVLQRLSLISLALANMEQGLFDGEATAVPSAQSQLQELDEIISSVRHVSHELHSNKLELLGLTAALKDLCRQLSAQHDTAIRLSADNIPSGLRPDLALCFYRVAQEGLSNSLKHSGSPRIDVCLEVVGGALRMSIQDFGRGFDPLQVANGLGLATMRERLRLVDGSLVLRSRVGEGAKVIAEAGPALQSSAPSHRAEHAAPGTQQFVA